MTPSMDPPESTDPAEAAESRHRSVPLLIAAAIALVGVVVVVALLVWPDREGQVLSYVVPAGTQSRIDAGEEVSLFPQRLEVRVGDRITIENRDDATHQVGPYVIGAGQRIEQHFGVPGTIEGFCTLHPSGQVSIVVR